MRLLSVAILGAVGIPAAAPAVDTPVAAASTGPADTVVLLSIDGMRWDYPARTKAPALARMAAAGASARTLIPPFPTTTFPAHASLVTGVHPDRHGIMNNAFLDRGRGAYRREDDASWLLAEPLWVTA
ncbi:MAG: alkaline phosphatase family protein, partial [Acidobacteriota bacterium]